MEAIPTLATTLSSAGLWTIVAILVVAVMYLFKETSKLNSEMRSLQTTFYNKLETTTERVTKAMDDNSKALSELREVIRDNFLSHKQ